MATVGKMSREHYSENQPGTELVEKLCDTLLMLVINNNNDHLETSQEDRVKKDAEHVLVQILEQEIAKSTEPLQTHINDLHKKLEEKEDKLQRSENSPNTKETSQKINDDDGGNDESSSGRIEEESEQTTNGNTINNTDMAHLTELNAKITHLEDELHKSESARELLKESLQKSEEERDEEMKIVQDALEEAAQEREALIGSFQMELERVNLMKATDEQQMMEDCEWKLSELKKEHKLKIQEKERQIEEALQKRKLSEEAEYLRKIEKLREELTLEWDVKSRAEICHLRAELTRKHSIEQRDAVESLEERKNKEIEEIRQSFNAQVRDHENEITSLKANSKQQIEKHARELDEIRTVSDRDLCQLRMRIQKLDDISYEKQQQIHENHKIETDQLHADYREEISLLQSRIHSLEESSNIKEKLQEQHMEDINRYELQNRINMERLIEEHEQEKIGAVEEVKQYMENRHREALSEVQTELEDLNARFLEQKLCTEELMTSINDKNRALKKLEEELCRTRIPSRNVSQTSSTSGICTGDFSFVSRNSSQSSIASKDSFDSSDEEIETEHECDD